MLRNLIRQLLPSDRHGTQFVGGGVLIMREKLESMCGAVPRLIRKFLIGTASILALGVVGNIASSALNDVDDAANTAPAVTVPAVVQNS